VQNYNPTYWIPITLIISSYPTLVPYGTLLFTQHQKCLANESSPTFRHSACPMGVHPQTQETIMIYENSDQNRYGQLTCVSQSWIRPDDSPYQWDGKFFLFWLTTHGSACLILEQSNITPNSQGIGGWSLNWLVVSWGYNHHEKYKLEQPQYRPSTVLPPLVHAYKIYVYPSQMPAVNLMGSFNHRS
jgi:hypothetical protein